MLGVLVDHRKQFGSKCFQDRYLADPNLKIQVGIQGTLPQFLRGDGLGQARQ